MTPKLDDPPVRLLHLQEATPYLRELWEPGALGEQGLGELVDKSKLGYDLGAGNGRNTLFLMSQGIETYAVDKAPVHPWIKPFKLGEESVPIELAGTAGIVLLQYVLMFLKRAQAEQVLTQATILAAPGTFLLVELQEVKKGRKVHLEREVTGPFHREWEVVHKRKDRCLLRRKDG